MVVLNLEEIRMGVNLKKILIIRTTATAVFAHLKKLESQS